MKKTIAILSLFLLIGAGCANSTTQPENNTQKDTIKEVDSIVQVEDNTESENDNIEVIEKSDVVPSNDSVDISTNKQNTETTTIKSEGSEFIFSNPPSEDVQEDNNENTEEDTSTVPIIDITLGGTVENNVNMESGNFFFAPNVINAAPSEKIKITFTKNSGFHTFVIDEMDIKFTISEGDALIITAPQTPGEYAFYCDIGSHRANGMEGTLIVK